VSLKSLQGDVEGIITVLHVIRSIAEQTNLLAINAAIEATRGGDAGAEMSATAQEVARHAVHSSRAADEADGHSHEGEKVIDATVTTITQMRTDIVNTAEVI